MSKSHSWHKFYPAGMPQTIDEQKLTNIAARIGEASRTHADKIALTCMGADMRFSAYEKAARDFAAFLQHEVGMKKGDRLAIQLPNVMQFPVVFYAAQKIGVICVNTNPLYTPREMRYQFKDSGATAIVIVDMFMDKLEKVIKDTAIKTVITTSIADHLPLLKGLAVRSVLKIKGMIPRHGLKHATYREAMSRGAGYTLKPTAIHQDDIAVLQYTGGTTGVSKGAMLTQRNILANMEQIRICAGDFISEGSETVLTALPLYHIFALSVNFLTFLAMGERMLLVPKPVPIANTIKLFSKYKITVMTGVNTLFNAMNNCPEFKQLKPRDLKFALTGGMALQDHVGREFEELTGCKVIQGFGLTEASPVTHVNPINSGGKIGSIGIPLASTDAKVVDSNGLEVAIGEVGELIVSGPQIMLGYWNRPDETLNTLRDGWLWTGDMAKADADGFFFIVDRKKDMILVSGFNVYPNEIEEVIASHSKVLEVAVVGIADKSSGEAVKAYVVAKDQSLTADELAKYCKENLTAYKRPKIVEFRRELPKSNIGKILRRELRDEMAGKEQPTI